MNNNEPKLHYFEERSPSHLTCQSKKSFFTVYAFESRRLVYAARLQFIYQEISTDLDEKHSSMHSARPKPSFILSRYVRFKGSCSALFLSMQLNTSFALHKSPMESDDRILSPHDRPISL
jgi:hypothetical protein